jgi:hypothetical protein
MTKTSISATAIRRQQQDREGALARKEYENNLIAVRARTERLRALRLAHEAEEATKAEGEKAAAALPKSRPRRAHAARG